MPEKKFKVLDNLSVSLGVDDNPYSIPPESIFSMAARNNPKRSYLFVSKLIGKHIPVQPRVPFTAGFLLASRLSETMGLPVSKTEVAAAAGALTQGLNHEIPRAPYHLPGKALFIGFAETATALGHSVCSCFTGDIDYLHTTRENLEGTADTIYFSEDHCHAPDQRCLINSTPLMKNNDLIVLVDDEITSGDTCLNMIRSIQRKYPQRKYVVLTILDWRTKEARLKYARMEEELATKIEVISLMCGHFQWDGTYSPVINNNNALAGHGHKEPLPQVKLLHEKMGYEVQADDSNTYLGYTGRFGVNVRASAQLAREASVIGKRLAQLRKGPRTLCLGTGEFMYTPFLIGSCMGEGVMVQSTTRSPVRPLNRADYAVKYAISFLDPFKPGVKNFVYNIPPFHYDDVFVFWERKVQPAQVAPLVQSFGRLGFKDVTFIYHCE